MNETTEAAIQTIDNNMQLDMAMQNMDIGNIMGIIAGAGIIFNIIFLVSFGLKAWGLYNINKKLGEPYPWLAWIPVIQIYSFVKAAGKPGIWILRIILGFIFFIIPGIVIVAILCSNIAKRTDRGFWSAVGVFFISPIMLPIIGHKLKDKSQNLGEEKVEEEIIENNIEL